MAAGDLSVLETAPPTLRHPPGTDGTLQGRAPERAFLDAHAAVLAERRCSVVLVGEAGIGKSALWRYGVARCRAEGALVLECRAAAEDRDIPGQGLTDLLGDRPDTAEICGAELTITERSRLLLEHLAALTAERPVVLAVDDVAWLDDLTQRVLRFCLRRLANLSVLATSRRWSPLAPDSASAVPDLAVETTRLEIGPMSPPDLAQVVARTGIGLSGSELAEIVRLAHGNPLFALELARRDRMFPSSSAPAVTLLAALRDRLTMLPEETQHVARLLAVAGPLSIPVLRKAGGLAQAERALHSGVLSDTFSVGDDFVVRFAHPLLATAVLDGVTPLDRRALHAALADAVDDPDTRVQHLARATIEADTAIAGELEEAALRLSRRGAPRQAADLLADSVRLTPSSDVEDRARRVLAQMQACATGGRLSTAIGLADELLAELPPGLLRTQVIARRVELDFTDAEPFLRATIAQLPDHDGAPGLQHGRLIGLLGWLLALHLARLPEGLALSRQALAIGRAHGDVLLTAQAAATISTAALMAGEREDALIEEAISLDADVPGRHLVMWPRVLLARQQLWDGRLADARHHHEVMYRRAVALGAELQRGYRLCDLAHVELAAGNLELVATYVEDGLEIAADSSDRRAMTWLAYPGGQAAALQGDDAAALRQSELLDAWSSRAGERPRSAMAAHIRGTLAASRREWGDSLAHLLTAIDVLDDLGVAHPGVVPVLPQAALVAAFGEESEQLGRLVDRLERAATSVHAPWIEAQALAGRGLLQWQDDQPDSLDSLLEAWSLLTGLGYRLDAARLGCAVVVAGLRWGHRRRVRGVAEDATATLVRERVLGWESLAAELRDRVAGARCAQLTTTEAQVADLVTAGRRNREIGAELFVSESTVEAHLTRIYRKLGVRNRAELIRALQPSDA